MSMVLSRKNDTILFKVFIVFPRLIVTYAGGFLSLDRIAPTPAKEYTFILAIIILEQFIGIYDPL